MRKPTKSSIKRKLDQVCSLIVRASGYCWRCGPLKYHDTLQCAHIYSRARLSVRWDLDNLLCLCADCHINFAHKNPLEFSEFVVNYLGPIKYTDLKFKANSLRKWTLEEMILRYEQLKKMHEECHGK